MVDLSWRFLPDAAIISLGFWADRLLLKQAPPSWQGRTLEAVPWLSRFLLCCGLVATLGAFVGSRLGFVWMNWRGYAYAWSCCLMAMAAVAWLWRRLERRPFSPVRRSLLRAAGSTAMLAPGALTTFGIVQGRQQFRLVEADIKIPALPKDLDGLRLVQLSDIHLSPYLSRQELRRCVDMANETRAHVALVTGDLVTGSKDPLDDCLTELQRLRSDAGTYGCLGNHEVYIDAEQYVVDEGRPRDLHFLRRARAPLRFGSALVNMAGVEYQTMRRPYLVGAASLKQDGAFNLLLCHNPDAFPAAAQQGWDLTLAGHTHGGQVNVEILEQNLNLVRAFVTPYVYGQYREGRSAMYVTRGIGTVGVPARIGAPPEVALVRLCAS